MDPVDLDRLERVRRWGAVVPTERDAEWIREFEAAFWPSLVVAPTDRIVHGSRDGRPYRVISSYGALDEGAQASIDVRATRPASLVDELIERGQGLLFGVPNGESTCVMTLGEVLSYRLYGRAFSYPAMVPKSTGVVEAGTMLRLAPPNEAKFPHWVRTNVRRYFQSNLGIDRPRAVWVEFPDGRSGLAFDLGATRGVDIDKRRAAFDGLRWYLPARMAHYALDQLERTPEMQPF